MSISERVCFFFEIFISLRLFSMSLSRIWNPSCRADAAEITSKTMYGQQNLKCTFAALNVLKKCFNAFLKKVRWLRALFRSLLTGFLSEQFLIGSIYLRYVSSLRKVFFDIFKRSGKAKSGPKRFFCSSKWIRKCAWIYLFIAALWVEIRRGYLRLISMRVVQS